MGKSSARLNLRYRHPHLQDYCNEAARCKTTPAAKSIVMATDALFRIVKSKGCTAALKSQKPAPATSSDDGIDCRPAPSHSSIPPVKEKAVDQHDVKGLGDRDVGLA